MISICYLAAHVYMREKAAASFVAALVIVYRCLTLLSAGDAGAYAFVLQRFSEPISVVTPIPEQPVRIRPAAEQCPCPDVIADLSGRDKEVDRTALAVADGVQLGPSRDIAAQCPAGQRFMPPLVRPIRRPL